MLDCIAAIGAIEPGVEIHLLLMDDGPLAEEARKVGAQVMILPRRMPPGEIESLIRRRANDPDVIEILPDRIFFPVLTPSDPQYANQWYLGAASGINAPDGPGSAGNVGRIE